jgi:ATP-dependent RNA helicase DHX37/DHR1
MHASLGKYTSDVFKTLSVIGAYEYAGGGQKFCSEHFVRPKVGFLDLSVIYGL